MAKMMSNTEIPSNDVASGSNVLVVGGTSGIGKAVVNRCLHRGAHTLAVGRHAESQSLPADALRMSLDLVDDSATSRLKSHVEQLFGGLDVLVYAASSFQRNHITDLTDDQWNEMMTVNATRFFQVVRELTALLSESEYPRIVAISSISGPVTGLPAMAHYGAAKCAIEGFVRTAALEFAENGNGITINAVRPGLVNTDRLEQSYGSSGIARMHGLIPRHELGTPDEVASAVCYLASPAASFISGATLVVDGAQTLVENPYAP